MSSTDMAGGMGSSGDLAASLRQSPFGALLDLPGVTPETIFGNINPADYASLNSGSGGNPFAGASAGSNPFTNYPGQTGLFSAATSGGASNGSSMSASGGSNPFAGGGAPAAASDMGGAPADSGQAAAMTSSDPTSMGASMVAAADDSGNPFASGGASVGGASMMGGAPDGSSAEAYGQSMAASAGYGPSSSGQQDASPSDPTGAAAGAVAGASGSIDFSNLSSDDAASLLAASPFGPLITEAGVDPATLLSSLSGGGANNFLALQGLGGANNPFGDMASSGSTTSSSDITSTVYAQITADGGNASQMILPTT